MSQFSNSKDLLEMIQHHFWLSAMHQHRQKEFYLAINLSFITQKLLQYSVSLTGLYYFDHFSYGDSFQFVTACFDP